MSALCQLHLPQQWSNLIVTSSTIDKIFEIYTFFENRTEIRTFFENRFEICILFENRIEICILFENRFEIYNYILFENRNENFEKFVNGRWSTTTPIHPYQCYSFLTQMPSSFLPMLGAPLTSDILEDRGMVIEKKRNKIETKLELFRPSFLK